MHKVSMVSSGCNIYDCVDAVSRVYIIYFFAMSLMIKLPLPCFITTTTSEYLIIDESGWQLCSLILTIIPVPKVDFILASTRSLNLVVGSYY